MPHQILAISDGHVSQRDDRAAAFRAEWYLGLHCDAFPGDAASGVSVWVNRRTPPSHVQRRFAIALCKTVSEVLQIKNRGVREKNFYVLNGRQPDCLLEMFFIPKDYPAYQKFGHLIAPAIMEIIEECFGTDTRGAVDMGHGMDNRTSGLYDPGASRGSIREATIVREVGMELVKKLREDPVTEPTPYRLVPGRAQTPRLYDTLEKMCLDRDVRCEGSYRLFYFHAPLPAKIKEIEKYMADTPGFMRLDGIPVEPGTHRYMGVALDTLVESEGEDLGTATLASIKIVVEVLVEIRARIAEAINRLNVMREK